MAEKECQSGVGVSAVWPAEITFDDQTINKGKKCSSCGVSLAGIPIPLMVTMENPTSGDGIRLRLCVSCADMLKTIMDGWGNRSREVLAGMVKPEIECKVTKEGDNSEGVLRALRRVGCM